MLDLLVLYFICSLVSFSVLRLVFASAIFSYYRKFIYSWKKSSLENKRWWLYYPLYGLNCWQCFGYWSAALTSTVGALFIPSSPIVISNVPALLMLILAVGVTTDIAGEFIPATVADFSDETDEEF